MQTIWKFPLDIADTQTIEIPKYADILNVQTQKGAVYIWAKVNPANAAEKRIFRVFGTGQPLDIEQNLEYIGSCQTHNESLVWHIYEERHIPRA